jgi:hypothetical protein
MARNRTPNAKAAVSGAALKNPQRYRDRTVHHLGGIGEPFEKMTPYQVEAWHELRRDLPWLRVNHRQIVHLACVLIAQMRESELGVAGMHALSSILSKLGATPVDESRVRAGGDDEGDPADRFFGKPN